MCVCVCFVTLHSYLTYTKVTSLYVFPLLSLQQSDYPYNENVPNIKIPMDMIEQEPFLGDETSDSE